MIKPLNVTLLRARLSSGLGVSLLSAMTLAIATTAQANAANQSDRLHDRLDVNQTAQITQSIPSPTLRTLERETLSLGSEGEDVREFQAIMTLLGHYSGDITGRFDAATAQAARSFQASANLRADAVIGPVTWGTLMPIALDGTIVQSAATNTNINSANNANTVPAPNTVRTNDRSDRSRPTLQIGSNGSFVSLLQQQLTSMGYYSGAIDGDFGPVTQAAVIEAQVDFGLVPNGIVDASVWPYFLN